MNRIITIGREFGSGGREIGRRLAEKLKIAYYDQEIVQKLAKRTHFSEEYIKQIDERVSVPLFPITVGRSFSPQIYPIADPEQEVFQEQSKLIRELSEKSDCIIVGRCADYILRAKMPLRLFIYADMDYKIFRCRERGDIGDDLSDKTLMYRIQVIDKKRAKYYRLYTNQVWGEKTNYDLCIITAFLDIETIIHQIAGVKRNR